MNLVNVLVLIYYTTECNVDVTKHSSAKTERGDERTTSPFHVLTVAVAVIVIPIALVVPKVLVVLVLHCKIK